MEPERQEYQEYKGHRIELRAREDEREEELELLIDDEPVRYGRLPNGRYVLREYAYDWHDNLMDLARAFIDYRDRADEIRLQRGRGFSGRPIRKNYRDLTATERNRFIQALYYVKSRGTVDQFANMHLTHSIHGIHGSSHFLPWHREFVLRFERELQGFHPEVTIPYWDSTVDRSPSDPLWDNSFLGQFDSAWNLGRALGSGPLPTTQQVQTNRERDTYDAFWRELENPIHNRPHVWVGGVMATYSSPADPVFYLHHAWIDLLWVLWQLANPGAPFVASGAGLGLNDPLMEWPDRTPANVLDHHALGYRYDIEDMWQLYDLAPAGSASPSGGITIVSRIPNSLEALWVRPNGSVRGAFWYEGEGAPWQFYDLAPAGNASPSGSITMVSRIPNSLEALWAGANGSVQGAFWYE